MSCVRDQGEKHVFAREGRKMSTRCRYHPTPKRRAKFSARSVTAKEERMRVLHRDGCRRIAPRQEDDSAQAKIGAKISRRIAKQKVQIMADSPRHNSRQDQRGRFRLGERRDDRQ